MLILIAQAAVDAAPPQVSPDHLTQVLWPFALKAFAIAITATSAVQLLKDLLPIRRRFQRHFLGKWFSQRLAERSKSIDQKDLIEAEADLVHLATGGDRDAFYDLEPGQLCGQMNSAAQIALAYPDRHPALLRFLAPEADQGDMDLVASTASAPNPQSDGTDVNELLDARNRITHHLQRSIDALQISMGFRWKFILQILIYGICFAASFGLFSGAYNGLHASIKSVATAVVAGFLAPVISDFAAAVNRWRRA